ncbi:MAG: nitronate monooxygenase [Gaiellales bacterium]|nr:nitronate monooxygenase [Gaiellales bacterium]
MPSLTGRRAVQPPPPGALWTPLCDLLGVRHALLLAGMAGGPNTPELVSAVSRAGGLGVLGVTGMTVDAVARATKAALARAGGGPVGVNVQLGPRSPATGARERISEVLAPFRAELGLAPEPDEARPADAPLALLETAVAAGASVITTFEDPTPAIAVARRGGIPLLAMVTTPDEALRAVAAGASAVIAQGSEAGGHRSAFVGVHVDPLRPEVGTMALVPQVVDLVGARVPVVASGGIMDGRGIAAALTLGAAGVSLGTRFLVARESGIPDCYRRALADCPADGTVVTDALTGRPARWIRNRFVDALIDAEAGTLGWGGQGALLADLRRAASAQERVDLLPMLAGQGAGLAGDPQSAEEIVALLLEQTDAARA